MTLDEYKKKYRISNPVHPNSVRKDNAKGKICKPSVQKIQRRFGTGPDLFFEGPFKIKIQVFGKSRGDIDNIAKGILDALQGVAYRNDRQCKEIEARFCEY